MSHRAQRGLTRGRMGSFGKPDGHCLMGVMCKEINGNLMEILLYLTVFFFGSKTPKTILDIVEVSLTNTIFTTLFRAN